MRQEKITFTDIYKDFKKRFPNLSKKTEDWRPNGYLSILIFFKDSSEMVYDYLWKKGSFIVLPGDAVQDTPKQ